MVAPLVRLAEEDPDRLNALRRVYGRGRLATVATMVILLLGYLVALMVTMLLTLAVTVATA